ncbi:amino acid adenylation domain-containing protein [Candidatus Gracilibacteria bacterium]|nr:amino acid adenylation domain-containing protein [Candidatus Gracilibacteria bacterium]
MGETALQNSPNLPPKTSVYPLSYGQKALWFLNKLNPESATYNTAFTVRIRSNFDVQAWRNALQRLVDRHPILRTRFNQQEGEPYQEVGESSEIIFEEINAFGWTEEALKEQVVRHYKRPFNLELGQVLRATLFTRSQQESVFLLAIHHLVRDGWSMLLLIDELRQLYIAEKAGQKVTLPPLKYDYQHYVQWQTEMLLKDGEVLWNYWRNQLAGELPVLHLPTDKPRLPQQNNNGASYTFKLDEITQLKTLAQIEKATLYMTLLAAFQVLLHRYTSQDDVLVVSPTAGRNLNKFSQIVGHFVNLVAIKAKITDNLTFKAFLAQVRQTVLEAIAHQDYPFALLVEQLQPQRDSNSLFQVAFVLQEHTQLNDVAELFLPQEEVRVNWDGLQLEPFVIPQEEGQFELTLEVIEGQESLFCVFKYNSDLFEESTIERMAGHFQNLLRGIVANPDSLVAQLPLLSEEEKHQLLVEWNSTEAEYPQHFEATLYGNAFAEGKTGRCVDLERNRCIHQLFEEQVEKTPDAIAVVFKNQQLTYRELNQKANQLARYLQSLGVGTEVLVGLCIERSIEAIVGLLGILKAGGAYVPLDPSYPTERLAFMLDDSQLKVLLTQQELIAKLPENQAQLICLDRDWTAIAQQCKDNLAPSVQPENLAYVIYTSGSTGKPKGVLVPHLGLINLVFWHQQAFKVTSSDRATGLAGIAFDAAGWEIYPYLTAGASIYLVDSETILSPVELQRQLIEKEITISFVPTPIAERLLSLEWSSNVALRIMLTGGDKLHFSPSASIPFKLVNNYGPTENTVVTTSGVVTHERVTPDIGRPIANTKVYILDRHLQPVPIGIPGELHISGAGLARGYLNRPELTEAKFISNPFDRSKLYKTGDLARYLGNGRIEYLGRIDNQVKIRGFRIELGEIETVLTGHPQIRETVVTVREDRLSDRVLVAYVVPNQKEFSSKELRSFLKQKLPDYMLPSVFVMLEAIPLTPNGKVDPHALPMPSQSNSEENCYIPPHTPTQEVLAAIWAELGLERVGIHDNFFELGGHSLLATQVISRVQAAFEIELPLQSLFTYPTIEELSQQIEIVRQAGLGLEFQRSRL